MSIYTENGYSSREEYIELLKEDYGTHLVDIFLARFPPSQDFTGLINAITEAYYDEEEEDEEEEDEEDEEEEEDDWDD
jgi:hypothetical protein